MYTDDLEYAQGRLIGTIVRYKGKPIRIADVFYDDDGEMCFTGRTATGIVETSLDLLDLEPIPLGYVNYQECAYYLVRKPMRNDWRQGLRPGNFTFIGREGFFELPLKELTDTCLNNYPTFTEARTSIKDGAESVAISRHFAIDSQNNFLYKSRVVGSYDQLITLKESFNHLSELLAETVYAAA